MCLLEGHLSLDLGPGGSHLETLNWIMSPKDPYSKRGHLHQFQGLGCGLSFGGLHTCPLPREMRHSQRLFLLGMKIEKAGASEATGHVSGMFVAQLLSQ